MTVTCLEVTLYPFRVWVTAAIIEEVVSAGELIWIGPNQTPPNPIDDAVQPNWPLPFSAGSEICLAADAIKMPT